MGMINLFSYMRSASVDTLHHGTYLACCSVYGVHMYDLSSFFCPQYIIMTPNLLDYKLNLSLELCLMWWSADVESMSDFIEQHGG